MELKPGLTRKCSQREYPSLFLFCDDRVGTVLLSVAVLAAESGPDGVELIDGGFHEGRLVGEDARFKIAGTGTFHSQTGTREIG